MAAASGQSGETEAGSGDLGPGPPNPRPFTPAGRMGALRPAGGGGGSRACLQRCLCPASKHGIVCGHGPRPFPPLYYPANVFVSPGGNDADAETNDSLGSLCPPPWTLQALRKIQRGEKAPGQPHGETEAWGGVYHLQGTGRAGREGIAAAGNARIAEHSTAPHSAAGTGRGAGLPPTGTLPCKVGGHPSTRI